MKIVSKHPDYYDYYSHVFGIDPLIRYERNSEFHTHPEEVFNYSVPGQHDWEIVRFFICGIVLDILVAPSSGKLLYGGQISELSTQQIKSLPNRKTHACGYSTFKHPKVSEVVVWYARNNKFFRNHKSYGEYVLIEPVHIDEFKVIFEPFSRDGYPNQYIDQNSILNCPVVMVYRNTAYKNPILANWGFGNIIPADELFTKISNWFLERMNKDIPNNQNDMEKLASHGFDKRTSFRH